MSRVLALARVQLLVSVREAWLHYLFVVFVGSMMFAPASSDALGRRLSQLLVFWCGQMVGRRAEQSLRPSGIDSEPALPSLPVRERDRRFAWCVCFALVLPALALLGRSLLGSYWWGRENWPLAGSRLALMISSALAARLLYRQGSSVVALLLVYGAAAAAALAGLLDTPARSAGVAAAFLCGALAWPERRRAGGAARRRARARGPVVLGTAPASPAAAWWRLMGGSWASFRGSGALVLVSVVGLGEWLLLDSNRAEPLPVDYWLILPAYVGSSVLPITPLGGVALARRLPIRPRAAFLHGVLFSLLQLSLLLVLLTGATWLVNRLFYGIAEPPPSWFLARIPAATGLALLVRVGQQLGAIGTGRHPGTEAAAVGLGVTAVLGALVLPGWLFSLLAAAIVAWAGLRAGPPRRAATPRRARGPRGSGTP